MISIGQIETFDELEHVGPLWNDLLHKSIDDDVFSTWEWISCWWKHFGTHRQLRVLVARENEQIVGIAPLMISSYRFMKLGKVNKIELIGSPEADYNNFILVKNEQKCLKLFLDHLARQTDWDTLELADVREGTLLAELVRRQRTDYGLKLEERVRTTCPYVNLPNTKDELIARLSCNARGNIRRTMRRLQEGYRVEFRTHSEFGSIQDAMDLFFDLHEKRWASKGKSGAFASDTVRDFHRDVAKLLAEKGWLTLLFLIVNGEAVAAEYSFDYRQKMYGYLSGFDPRFAVYGVQTLVQLKTLEMCIATGIREFDFLRGDEEYKSRWGTQARKNLEISVVRKGLLAKLQRLAKRNEKIGALARKLGQSVVLES